MCALLKFDEPWVRRTWFVAPLKSIRTKAGVAAGREPGWLFFIDTNIGYAVAQKPESSRLGCGIACQPLMLRSLE
jgi:hypothetical protein